MVLRKADDDIDTQGGDRLAEENHQHSTQSEQQGLSIRRYAQRGQQLAQSSFKQRLRLHHQRDVGSQLVPAQPGPAARLRETAQPLRAACGDLHRAVSGFHGDIGVRVTRNFFTISECSENKHTTGVPWPEIFSAGGSNG